MGAAEVAEPPPRVRASARTCDTPRSNAEPPANVLDFPAGPGPTPFAVPPPFELPADARTLDGFLRWVEADGCPPGYRVTFFRGRLIFEPSMEDIDLHGLLKLAVAGDLRNFEGVTGAGVAYPDGTWFRNREAGVSTEPDVLFVLNETFTSGRVTRDAVSEKTGKRLVLSGSPDLLVEIVSDSSVTKDTADLRAGYFDAGVREYWILDARQTPPTFALLTRSEDADDWSELEADEDGFRRSPVLNRRVRLDRTERRHGGPRWDVRLEE